MGVFNIASNYKKVFNYKFRNSILFDLKTTIYIFNNQVKFISEIEPILDCIYIGLYIKEIIGFGIAIVIINNFKGEKNILLTRAAYILNFYINLIYIQKFNNKGVY